MSFNIICDSCGAPSSSEIGICPYCKSVMASKAGKSAPTVARIKKCFDDGHIEQALSLAADIEAQKPDLLKDKEFVLLYARILFEAEGPSTKIKSLLNHALFEHPSDPLLLEYLEVAEAESNLSRERNDAGETALINIVRRSPHNYCALFLLGRHLFWVERDAERALIYLEQCVRIRPNFLRAAGCLVAVYKALNMNDSAAGFCADRASKTADPKKKQLFAELAKAKLKL